MQLYGLPAPIINISVCASAAVLVGGVQLGAVKKLVPVAPVQATCAVERMQLPISSSPIRPFLIMQAISRWLTEITHNGILIHPVLSCLSFFFDGGCWHIFFVWLYMDLQLKNKTAIVT